MTACAPEECPLCGDPVEWGSDQGHSCVPGFEVIGATLVVDIDAEVEAFAERLKGLDSL